MRAGFQRVLNRVLERRRMETAGDMTILEHLQELRRRLTISVLGLLVATVASFLFTEPFLRLLLAPATSAGITVVAIEPTENLTTFIKVAFISGLALASPIVLSQIILFVAPGLTARERRVVFTVLPFAILLFALGALFCYWVVLPSMLKFLFGFLIDIATPTPRISAVIGLITTLVLWIGLVFETPLIMGILSWLDIVRASTFSRYRRYAIVAAFVAGAFITPTGDPLNMTIVAVPIIILYEIGTLAARVVGRRQAAITD